MMMISVWRQHSHTLEPPSLFALLSLLSLEIAELTCNFNRGDSVSPATLEQPCFPKSQEFENNHLTIKTNLNI
ncbi:hypothetical protein EON65_18445 [archaeon]|nr:MAG: hypothetical protein EON65_18445 [archaeon]